MITTNFFDQQSDLTASKILIYQKYLKNYLPKVLMQYGKCFIADFFCGPGKNGENPGSPLILLDEAKNILESPVLRQKWPNPEVVVLFSDSNKSHIENLTLTLKQSDYPKEIKIIGPICEGFDSILEKSKQIYSSIKEPKFFFLDPFTYSEVTMENVKCLIDVIAAEVLLFLPTFHSFRFVKCADASPKLKEFLEAFTTKGCANYSDIFDFNESIRSKLLSDLNLKYVSAIGLDGGAKKNALFYLTKHITGKLLMDRLVWKIAYDGVTVKAKKDIEPTLFDLSPLSDNFSEKKDLIENYVKDKKCVTNVEIIEFVAINGFTTKYANDILKDMKKQGLIQVEYKDSSKTHGLYISDAHWNNELSIIKYKE
ncbi:MAG: three-Cys-motif partner protein TcmP [Endomicrobiales bacterium]|nr:three-Cys-motif partner protein TcmP [Endomicrobiales bacterium]